jgi:hypothetical protein
MPKIESNRTLTDKNLDICICAVIFSFYLLSTQKLLVKAAANMHELKFPFLMLTTMTVTKIACFLSFSFDGFLGIDLFAYISLGLLLVILGIFLKTAASKDILIYRM